MGSKKTLADTEYAFAIRHTSKADLCLGGYANRRTDNDTRYFAALNSRTSAIFPNKGGGAQHKPKYDAPV